MAVWMDVRIYNPAPGISDRSVISNICVRMYVIAQVCLKDEARYRTDAVCAGLPTGTQSVFTPPEWRAISGSLWSAESLTSSCRG